MTEDEIMAQVKTAVSTIKDDVAKFVADVKAKLAAAIGVSDNSADLQSVLSDLNTLHDTLTTEDAKIAPPAA